MMENGGALFWLYMTNLVLLINHEIDAAYWQEWKLVSAPIGISGFVALHFPLLYIFMYGLVLVENGAAGGYPISLAMAALGIFAPLAHAWFLWNGRPEFKTAMSIFILAAMLVISVAQMAVTLDLMLVRVQ